MGLNLDEGLGAPVLNLDTVISTNNYAMQLIDADTAPHGTTITAAAQTGGKGQRGKTWIDEPGSSLLMSIILKPRHTPELQFPFSACVAVRIATCLQDLYDGWEVRIKWPNDIIVNDKKAAGILIENVLRGGSWLYAIVGIGLNVRQEHFPAALPHATSLLLASGRAFSIPDLTARIRASLLGEPAPDDQVLRQYNKLLYRRSCGQLFTGSDGQVWTAVISGVLPDGSLQLRHVDGRVQAYRHGALEWHW